MKKRTLVLLLCPLLLLGCSTNNGGNGGNGQQNVTRYTVTFANTSMSSVQIAEGSNLNRPADPQKANSMFVGWYYDAAFTREVSFPVTITGDLTIYAQFYSYQEAFAKARNNTIGEQVPGYEYDYTLRVTAGYMGVNFNGNTSGNAKYNPGSEVSFYDEHVNSGSLFYDGTKYTFKKGTELHDVSVDENDVVKKYTIKQVDSGYKYDSSSFAKAVFEYDDTKLKEIKPTGTSGEYSLKTSFTFSQGVALVGNYVNHPMVEKIIGELPETSVATGMYVSFNGDKLNTYRYEMAIDVSGVQFTLTYNLTFKNIGRAPSISPRTFANTSYTPNDVNQSKAEVNGILNTYKALAHSSYDFKVKTAVDYAKKNAINATIDGFTKRKVSGGQVYYLNDYEVDTDHKNADLYKSQGLGDCHGGRVKLSNGEVHDLKKKVLSGYTDVGTATHQDIDNYYLLDVFGMIDNVSFIQKVTNGTKTTYAIGTETPGAVNVLKQFNNALRLNPLRECSVDVKAFGSFNDSSVTVKNFKFKIITVSGALSEISLEMNGKLTASFPGSRDFQSAQDAGYKLTYSLTVTNDGASYEPAASVDKVK